MSGFIIFFALLPSFAWLLFFLKEDYRRPEPKKMIIFAFLLGAAFTFLAFYFEILADSWFKKIGIPEYSSPYFFSFSLIEEVLKFLAVFWFTRKSKFFDESIDIMVYMIAVSLGFAAVENIGAILGQFNSYANIGIAFHTATLRFIGANLLHSLSSAMVGYWWAKGIKAHEQFLFISEGIILATLLHTIFNYLIMIKGAVMLPTMLLLIVGFIVLGEFEKLDSLKKAKTTG